MFYLFFNFLWKVVFFYSCFICFLIFYGKLFFFTKPCPVTLDFYYYKDFFYYFYDMTWDPILFLKILLVLMPTDLVLKYLKDYSYCTALSNIIC